jgi:glycosyltransferase involved in cell wall biosynthesis
MYQGYSIAVVMPAYNEEVLIGRAVEGVPSFVDRIYVVDDASTDATPQIIRGFDESRVCTLFHGRNRGVGAAIVTGYKRTVEEGMDIAVVMAGDNQMNPAELPRLLTPLVEGEADYAKGNRLSEREHRHGMSSWRLFGNRLLAVLTKVASGYWSIGDPQNGYAAITTKTLRQINLDRVYPRYGYCNDLLVRLNVANCRVVDVPMPARYGDEKSNIRYGGYIRTVSAVLLRGFLWRIRMKVQRSDRRGNPC